MVEDKKQFTSADLFNNFTTIFSNNLF